MDAESRARRVADTYYSRSVSPQQTATAQMYEDKRALCEAITEEIHEAERAAAVAALRKAAQWDSAIHGTCGSDELIGRAEQIEKGWNDA